MKIKVCGMRDPANITEIASLGPDYIGFIFYSGSKRCNDRNSASAVRRSFDGIRKTGVFVDEDPVTVLDLAAEFDLNVIQFHGAETPDYCLKIKSAGFSVIKSFPVDASINNDRLFPYLQSCDYFLFDTASDSFGGSGKSFNWDLLLNYTHDKPFFLSGGISPADSARIKDLRHPALYGVDINSRFEISPGIKDALKIKIFIDGIKNYTHELQR